MNMGMIFSFNMTSKLPYPSGLLMSFRGYAINGVGVGLYSDILIIEADQVPQYMTTPVVTLSNISPSWIYVTWTGIVGDQQTGGDSASFYGLEWDQANSTWSNLTKLSMGMTYSFNLTAPHPPFSSGCTIKFRAYAKNGVGFGIYSSLLSIQADSVPLYMNSPLINYGANMINPNWIYVTWPGIQGDNQTGGDPANYYGLDWDQGIGSWLRVSNDSLGGLHYSYNLTSKLPYASAMTIHFRLIARNGVGFGAYSKSLQITADSVPLRMNSPMSARTDYNLISLSWIPISSWADTGGDNVVYYQV